MATGSHSELAVPRRNSQRRRPTGCGAWPFTAYSSPKEAAYSYDVRILGVSGAVLLLLTACGGGGGSGVLAPVGRGAGAPSATPSPAPSSSPSPGDAHFTISDPYSTTQSAKRRPQYFSPATEAIRITTNGSTVQINLSPQSSNCAIADGTISCAIDVPVKNGPLTYSVQTLDPYGAVLSQAGGTATIDGTTTIPLALQGVWKTATVQFTNEHPLMGSPTTIAMKVSAYDADGALIIGPEPYTTPIVLHNSDTSGATSLSKTTLTSPCECVTLSYDGKSYVNAIVTPVNPATGAPGQGDMLVPALRITEYPVPSGSNASTNGGNSRMFINADNSITFLEQNMHIGRVTMAGAVTETTVADAYMDIAETPDGSLWGLTNYNYIDRINSDGSATPITQLPGGNDTFDGRALTVGPDGNLWAAIGTTVGPAVTRVTPTGSMTTFVPIGPQYLGDGTVGADGNLWYAAQKNGGGEFERLTPAGQFTEFAIPNADVPLGNVALGPDGQVYSTLGMDAVERVTTDGVVSSLPELDVGPFGFYGPGVPNPVAFGPDGALWISGAIAPNTTCDPVVERNTTNGGAALLELPIACDAFYSPVAPITAFIIGPDGNLWYTRGSFVGKIVLK